MSLPDVTETILENGLGVISPASDKVQVKVGPTQKGTLNTLYGAANSKTAQSLVGTCPLLEAVAQVLDAPGGGASVIMVPSLPTNYGTVTGAFALEGGGSGTVTGSKGPEQIVKVKIGTGGLPGVMTYQVAVGTGTYGPIITSSADPYSALVPGQSFTKLAFGNFTYIANDVYQLNLDGTVIRTGSGTSSALNGSTNSPTDQFEIWVAIVTGGALGVGAFRYSMDGGTNYSGSIILPSAGIYVIPGSGVVLTFAGTFTVGDTYKGATTPPTSSSSDVNTALVALLANPLTWDHVHVVGTPANAAGAFTLAGIASTQMGAAQAGHRYAWALTECPAAEGDTTLSTTFTPFVDHSVAVAAGDAYVRSPLSGRVQRRNAAWVYSARISAIAISIHPGQVSEDDNAGPLHNVVSIVRDEAATPGLDPARFVTLRTIVDVNGYFVSRGRMMASPGSDFEEVMNLRVMNRTVTVGRAAALKYLNKKLRITPKGLPRAGFIDERDAQAIERIIQAKCRAAIVTPGDASDVVVVVSRTDNILSTRSLTMEIGPVPDGYAEHIGLTLGFKNLALQAG
jgi:hypothetical protein